MPNGTLTHKRGEIWWVDLKPVVGNETDKERPCLILQNDIGNQNATTTIVAPLLPGTKTLGLTHSTVMLNDSEASQPSGDPSLPLRMT